MGDDRLLSVSTLEEASGIRKRGTEPVGRYLETVGRHYGVDDDLLEVVIESFRAYRDEGAHAITADQRTALSRFYQQIRARNRPESAAPGPDRNDGPTSNVSKDPIETFTVGSPRARIRHQLRRVERAIGLGRMGKRAVAVATVVLLVTPMLVTGFAIDPSAAADPPSVIFVTVEGDEDTPGGVHALDAETGERLQSHTSYDAYLDVEVINETTVLYLIESDAGTTDAVFVDWRTMTVEKSVRIRPDVSRVGVRRGPRGHVYLYLLERGESTDGEPESAEQRDLGHIYAMNATSELMTDVRVEEALPTAAMNETAVSPVQDIDFLAGGFYMTGTQNVYLYRSQFEWTFGGWHPRPTVDDAAVLSGDSSVLLVAETDAGRVVEYKRDEGDWRESWAYEGTQAPGAIGRLDDGRTIVADQERGTVISVGPDTDVGWQRSFDGQPRDITVIQNGDDEQGPPVAAVTGEDESRTVSSTAGTVVVGVNAAVSNPGAVLQIPSWVERISYANVVGALAVLGAWFRWEWRAYIRK